MPPADSGERNRRIVLGLGNPGRRYVGTRHNVGFEVLETLRRRWGGTPRTAFSSEIVETVFRPGGEETRALLVAPQTYMNRSGQAAQKVVSFFKLPLDCVLVVMDDMALPTGAIRLRADGSAGGHNGLNDIQRALGGSAVPRLRIGIGAAPGPIDPADYVLGRFTAEELETIRPAVETAADAVETWAQEGINRAMDTYNRRPDADAGR